MTDQSIQDWIIKRLQELPDQECPGYEQAVYELRPKLKRRAATLALEILRIVESPILDVEYELRQFIKNPSHLTPWIKGVLDKKDLSKKIRFNAFFVIQIDLWQHSDYEEFRNNVKNYRSDFHRLPMWIHQQAMASLSKFDRLGLRKALRYAQIARCNLSKSPGIMNLFAEVVAELEERYPSTLDKSEISAALYAIDRAIEFDPDYGKYHANRARLLSLENHFDAAEREIRRAIEIEPSSVVDNVSYFIRLLRYEAQWERIRSRRREEEQQKILDELRRTRSETMVMLGLLATIVGFIVAVFDIATDYKPLASAAIIGLLAGLILVVFAGFATMVRWDSSRGIRIGVAVVGIVLIVAYTFILFQADLQEPHTARWPWPPWVG